MRSALRISFSRPSRASSASRASSNGPIRSSTISATAFARLSLATSCFSQMTWVLARPSRQSRRFGSSSGFDGSSQPFSSSLQASCSSGVGDAYFHPLWEMAGKLHLPIAFHSGNGSFLHHDFFDADTTFTKFKLAVVGAFQTPIQKELPSRFPKVRWGFIEVSAQWIPYVLNDLSDRFRRKDKPFPDDPLGTNHIWVACENTDDLPYVVTHAGEDHLMIGTDYGHHDPSTELNAIRLLRRDERLAPAVIEKILEKESEAILRAELKHMKPLAVITGGASLIGEGIAQRLVEGNWSVALVDIEDQVMTAVAQRIGAGIVAAEPMDVTDLTSVRRVLGALAAEHGGIAGLVNVAGGGHRIGAPMVPFMDSRPEHWDCSINVNLKGVLNCCYTVLPGMKEAGRGGIVNMAAGRGLRGAPHASLYSMTKAGILRFTQSVAQEVGRYGIRINAIVPGSTAVRWGGAEDQSPNSRRSEVPLGRPTDKRDIGEAVAFLLSDKASHITGACLDTSGGISLH